MATPAAESATSKTKTPSNSMPSPNPPASTAYSSAAVSRKAISKLAKGKGRAIDLPSHADSCSRCKHQNLGGLAASNAAVAEAANRGLTMLEGMVTSMTAQLGGVAGQATASISIGGKDASATYKVDPVSGKASYANGTPGYHTSGNGAVQSSAGTLPSGKAVNGANTTHSNIQPAVSAPLTTSQPQPAASHDALPAWPAGSMLSPDCVLYSNPNSLLSAKTPKCTCPKDCSKAPSEKVYKTYDTLQKLFLDRFRFHDLPLVFWDEVCESERTIVPEMVRDMIVGRLWTAAESQSSISRQASPAPAAPPMTPQSSWLTQGVNGPNPSYSPMERLKGANGRRQRVGRLADFPDPEARLAIREELVNVAKALGREVMFDTTAPVLFEELSFLADMHGWSSFKDGPPCACILSVCPPCLEFLRKRLVPPRKRSPQPHRDPPDYSFLTYSAHALKRQGLMAPLEELTGRRVCLQRVWEEELKDAQKRTGDAMWQMAVEVDLSRVTRESTYMLDGSDSMTFYKEMMWMFANEPGHEAETYKAQRDSAKIAESKAAMLQSSRSEMVDAVHRAEREKVKGNVAFGKGLYRRAAKHFTAAMELDPQRGTYPLNRAAALLKLEKYRSAERDCTACIDLDPRSAKALFRRAMARKGQGRLIEAEADLNLVLAIEPRNAAVEAELAEVTAMLFRTAGSSSWSPYAAMKRATPIATDTVQAQKERMESEAYWKERFQTCLVGADPLTFHRGRTDRPCRAYNQAIDGCPLGESCPDSHAPDEFSIRVESLNRNVCLLSIMGGCAGYGPDQRRLRLNGSREGTDYEGSIEVDDVEADEADDDLDDADEDGCGPEGSCPYSHATPDDVTIKAVKEIEHTMGIEGVIAAKFNGAGAVGNVKPNGQIPGGGQAKAVVSGHAPVSRSGAATTCAQHGRIVPGSPADPIATKLAFDTFRDKLKALSPLALEQTTVSLSSMFGCSPDDIKRILYNPSEGMEQFWQNVAPILKTLGAPRGT